MYQKFYCTPDLAVDKRCVGEKLWLERVFIGYGAIITGDVAVFAELIGYGAGDDFVF